MENKQKLMIFVAGALTGALAMYVYKEKELKEIKEDYEEVIEDADKYYTDVEERQRLVIERQSDIIDELNGTYDKVLDDLEYKGLDNYYDDNDNQPEQMDLDDIEPEKTNLSENYLPAYAPAAINEGNILENPEPHFKITDKLNELKPDLGLEMEEEDLKDIEMDEYDIIYAPSEEELEYEEQLEMSPYVEELTMGNEILINLQPGQLPLEVYEEMVTFTWYMGDDILADERGEMVPYAENIVGEGTIDALMNQEGVVGPDEIYIYNSAINQAIHIVKDLGKYTKEVLGYEE